MTNTLQRLNLHTLLLHFYGPTEDMIPKPMHDLLLFLTLTVDHIEKNPKQIGSRLIYDCLCPARCCEALKRRGKAFCLVMIS